MKKLTGPLLLATAAVIALSSHAQGTFQNLDFESAKWVSIPGSLYYPYEVATTNALPGWTVYYDTNQQGTVFFNDPSLGSTCVSIVATNGSQLQGSFSVLLQGGALAGSLPLRRGPASISQIGVVPSDARSLQFMVGLGLPLPGGDLTLSLSGVSVPFLPLFAGPAYTLYGADVFRLAGQQVNLRFSALPPADYPSSAWLLDSIRFSSEPIPEPTALTLAVLIAFLFRRSLIHRKR